MGATEGIQNDLNAIPMNFTTTRRHVGAGTDRTRQLIPCSEYLRDIWDSRFFWIHLSRAELRARFRNSRLGILWAFLQPLLLTLLMTFIFGAVFHIPMVELAPFVFSGVLVWDFVCGSWVVGCASFINAAPYIGQKHHPLVIYPLKSVLSTCAIFCIGMVGLLLWIGITRPANLGLPLASLLFSLPLYLSIAWAFATIAAVINTKFRDFQFAVGLVLQALWYLSPVFLQDKLFRSAHVEWLLVCNPLAHVLCLVRAPLLDGHFPTPENFLGAIGLMLASWITAIYLIRREEPTLIFYL